jgi:hypothetical protein
MSRSEDTVSAATISSAGSSTSTSSPPDRFDGGRQSWSASSELAPTRNSEHDQRSPHRTPALPRRPY